MKYKVLKKFDKYYLKDIHNLYKKEWWTKERKKKDIKKMLKNSDITIMFIKKGKVIAFARVLSDFVYKAEIYDVIVKEKYRKKGLGKKLIKEILTHKKLKNVEQFNLQCKEDIKSFYKKFGFKEVKNLTYMRKIK